MAVQYDKYGNVIPGGTTAVQSTSPTLTNVINYKKPMTDYGVTEGRTPWGTKITDGRTTEQVAQTNIAQTQTDVSNQLADVGYTIKPNDVNINGASYAPDQNNVLSEIVKPAPGVVEDFTNRTTDTETVVPAPETGIGDGYTTEQLAQPGGQVTNNTPVTTGGGQYSDYLNNVIAELTGMDFSYDPNTDSALKQAQDYAARAVLEEMNSRGIFRSSGTQDRLVQTINELIPQYEQLAYQRYQDDRNNLYKQAELYMDIDEINYSRGLDDRNFAIDEELRALDQEQAKRDEAWDRLETIGYISSNEDAILLGMPVGTESQSMREYHLKQDAIAEQNRQALISEKANNQKELTAKNADLAYNVLLNGLPEILGNDTNKIDDFINLLANDTGLAEQWAEVRGKPGIAAAIKTLADDPSIVPRLEMEMPGKITEMDNAKSVADNEARKNEIFEYMAYASFTQEDATPYSNRVDVVEDMYSNNQITESEYGWLKREAQQLDSSVGVLQFEIAKRIEDLKQEEYETIIKKYESENPGDKWEVPK